MKCVGNPEKVSSIFFLHLTLSGLEIEQTIKKDLESAKQKEVLEEAFSS
jgi:hypothetical protein